MTKKNVMPTLIATVTIEGSVSGDQIVKSYEITKEDINDMDWFGGSCGDSYFDDREDDEERFKLRLQDVVQGNLYGDSDPETGGESEEFIGYHEDLNIDINYNGFKMKDFFPN